MSERESGDMIGHYPCIGNEFKHKNDCESSDALAVYQHENEDGDISYDAYCYSCCQHFKESEVNESSLCSNLGIEEGKAVKTKKPKVKEVVEPMDRDKVLSFIKANGYESSDYRGIKDEYSKFYGHLTRLDHKGEVLARYYPETTDYDVKGYKCRNHPKDFRYGKVGKTGIKSDLSGQVKFKTGGGKYLLIVGGEEDKVAAFQMLRESQIQRGQADFEPIPVVSPTTGEGSASKQIASQYEWIDTFDNIIIGMDNDKAGLDCLDGIIKVLPEEKVRIAKWTGKDPNAMLQSGKEKQFVRDFYASKEYIQTDIKHSADSFDSAIEFLSAEKIELPPYLHRLQTKMRGGIKSTGAIINLIGDTSIGKSLFTDSLLYHWFWNSPIVPTIISLERTEGELAVDFISMHLKHNLSWYEDGNDAIKVLKDPDNKTMIDDLLVNDIGESRYHILDERSGDMKALISVTERAFKQYGSRLIIFDPLTDFLRSLGNEAQEEFMMWQKRKKKEGCIFLNILHTRKPIPDKDGKIRKVTEYDALGSGTFVQSADANIVINRDKMDKDPVQRNTTVVDLPKMRGGSTGHVGDIYYDFESRTLHDKEDYFGETPTKEVEDNKPSKF